MPVALVVDDAPDIRLLIREVLERAGYSVVEAGSGPEALSLLALPPLPDVAVVDVQMPDMDGWELLALIRGSPLTRDLRAILCTVKASAADAVRAWELGCDGYLNKPFSISDLAAEVLAVTERTAAQRLAVRAARRAAVLDHAT